jgi:toxin ParE1/3/4
LAAADRLVARIAGATQRLADFPESGTQRPELAGDARGGVVGSYLILYRVGPGSVDILRIVHGARELTALLARNGKE